MRAGGPAWWGWHELADGAARQLVASACIRPGDLVLDVGAGRGALTAPLVEAGARVVAIELHPRRIQVLRRRFPERVTVVRADAADLRLPRRPYHVVANPPFGVTTALVRRLVAPGSRLLRAHLVLPRHVARRWEDAAAPGARRWRRCFDAGVVAEVPRAAFRPPPQADALVLRIARRPGTQI